MTGEQWTEAQENALLNLNGGTGPGLNIIYQWQTETDFANSLDISTYASGDKYTYQPAADNKVSLPCQCQ
jgi:hypothetical protein